MKTVKKEVIANPGHEPGFIQRKFMPAGRRQRVWRGEEWVRSSS